LSQVAEGPYVALVDHADCIVAVHLVQPGVSSEILLCPKCAAQNVYPDGDNNVCADCGHEWSAAATVADPEAVEVADDGVIRDANGVALANGDSVVLIKSLKVKGSTTLKQGTKISNIKLISGDHEIDCRVDNMGMLLQSAVRKKSLRPTTVVAQHHASHCIYGPCGCADRHMGCRNNAVMNHAGASGSRLSLGA
jgi:protein PhnA